MGGSEAADWIAAIGQAVGAIGTLAAVVVALLIARRDGQRLETDRREREAAQARLVTARVDEDWRDIVDGSLSQLVVRNNSDHAIADLYVVGVKMVGRNFRWLPDDRDAKFDVVAPGSSATFNGKWEFLGAPRPSPHVEGEIEAINARLQFADSSGGWWQRVGNDHVVRSARKVDPRESPQWERREGERPVPKTVEPDGSPRPLSE